MSYRRIFLLPLTILALTACSSTDKIQSEVQIEQDVEYLYSMAADALDQENYRKATKLFEDVERQYPYSQWATKAQLMAAYSSYLAQNYDEVFLALDRFIQLHPGNEHIDYAYYLKALSLYEQISDVRRDQKMTKEALGALNAVIRRFPDSKYARDARLKRDLTADHLAGKEMEIGRYYLNRGHINAAINRFRIVILRYQTTTHTVEALHRLVESYLTLGLVDEATRVAAVLGHNYPGSIWYKKSYDLLDEGARAKIISERGFIDRTIESIFKPD